MKYYRIKDWDTHFENSRSRAYKDLSWVPLPNSHDGFGYARLMRSARSAEIFAAWVLIVQVASRCQQRGSLLTADKKPYDSEMLAIRTRSQVEWFETAIPMLLDIGWLEQVTEEKPAPLSARCQHAGLEEKRIEENRREQGEQEFSEGEFDEKILAIPKKAPDFAGCFAQLATFARDIPRDFAQMVYLDWVAKSCFGRFPNYCAKRWGKAEGQEWLAGLHSEQKRLKQLMALLKPNQHARQEEDTHTSLVRKMSRESEDYAKHPEKKRPESFLLRWKAWMDTMPANQKQIALECLAAPARADMESYLEAKTHEA